jgi:hypothetical protein
MNEVLSKLRSDEVVVLVFLSGGVLIALTAIVAHHWRRLRQLEIETALKQTLLQKGMNAEEIERVVNATQGATYADTPPVTTLNDKQLEAKIAADLAAHGVSTNLIEKALEAVMGAGSDTKRAVAEMVPQMIENGTDDDLILTAIQTLCRADAHALPAR